jgi:DNA-binding MarR family transcriptional regulator
MHDVDQFREALRKWSEVFMQRSMQSFMMHAKRHGLSPAQANTLFFIKRAGSAGVSNIGDDLGITSAAASQMIERLVQQGLILRSEDPNDRRLKRIVLSDKGTQLIREGFRAQQVWQDDLAGCLNPQELAQVTDALNLLAEKVRLVEPPSDSLC